MKVLHFGKIVAGFFEYWFKILALDISQGKLKITRSYSWPRGLRIAQSSSHFIVELVGSSEKSPLKGLRLDLPHKAENIANTSAFFCPGFDIDDTEISAIRIAKQRLLFSNMTLCTEYDKKIFEKKINFPILGFTLKNPKAKVPLVILPSADHLIFHNINIIKADIYRLMYRTISVALVVRHDALEADIVNGLSRETSQLRESSQILLGVNLGHDRSLDVFTKQLVSLADQNVKERIIDDFIRLHGHWFAKALGYQKALPHPKLKWIKRVPECQQEACEPDFLMEKNDGYFDILDLKKGLLRRPVTKGKPGRLRFIDYVTELIAQLNCYRRYFDARPNQEWAFDQHGVKVNNPRLIGIVGNYDTFNRERVTHVLEQYRDDIILLSYSDIVNLLRARDSA